ncbi:arylsulfatase [Oceanicoccus sp. KOV_DT_Chl]|uniref:arylsulfatase n=1 Tax=Oceanicoccus sp. KOV_DT_Chl TaxID=1904639 RepID=UPI000C7DC716|nr:arylsulfatase [Oceanicoccus sp. KOV_DT_Chl]
MYLRNRLYTYLTTLIIQLLACTYVFSQAQPNILLIVADDLGFSDLGAFGGEISTPTIDQLASEGLRLSNFHTQPTCSLTRAVLMSGVDNHLAGMGTLSELITPAMKGHPGYIGQLNFKVATLPELLHKNGYHTYIAGKWHLGETQKTDPFSRGFEQSFSLLTNGGSHWYDQKPLSPSMKMRYTENGRTVPKLPKDFYSTRNFTDFMLGKLKESEGDGKPFFAYLSYMAPHNPLHAPKAYIDKYKGTYNEGWDALRRERLNSLKRIGMVEPGIKPFPRLHFVPAWHSLPPEQQKTYARRMEIYAAMIDYMDEQIGRVLSYLRQSNQYDNTIIIFMSDNGANGAPNTTYPNQTGDYLASFDNSLENSGLTNSYVDMGAGWAQASMTPHRLFKSIVTEGGTLSPLVVKLPGKMINAGNISAEFTSIRDIMPTLLDLAGISPIHQINRRATLPLQGKTLLPLLSGKTSKAYKGANQFGTEIFGNKAYTSWPWKIVLLSPPLGSGAWQLFNLEKDPAEMTDLSLIHIEKRKELLKLWQHYKIKNNVIDF